MLKKRKCELLFQSTLPRGSDINLVSLLHLHAYFNPRSLAGATLASLSSIFINKFQSTLPRGSDGDGVSCFVRQVISIHAPSRERPFFKPPLREQGRISIHAPSRERLFALTRGRRLRKYFNPRSLAGATLLNIKSI